MVTANINILPFIVIFCLFMPAESVSSGCFPHTIDMCSSPCDEQELYIQPIVINVGTRIGTISKKNYLFASIQMDWILFRYFSYADSMYYNEKDEFHYASSSDFLLFDIDSKFHGDHNFEKLVNYIGETYGQAKITDDQLTIGRVWQKGNIRITLKLNRDNKNCEFHSYLYKIEDLFQQEFDYFCNLNDDIDVRMKKIHDMHVNYADLCNN